MIKEEYCPTVSAFRTHKVAKQKPVPVSVYDYYDSCKYNNVNVIQGSSIKSCTEIFLQRSIFKKFMNLHLSFVCVCVCVCVCVRARARAHEVCQPVARSVDCSERIKLSFIQVFESNVQNVHHYSVNIIEVYFQSFLILNSYLWNYPFTNSLYYIHRV